MKGNLAEIIMLFLLKFLFIFFLKSWPFFNICSGAVNLNNLNFLWFNVEQVRFVLKREAGLELGGGLLAKYQ